MQERGLRCQGLSVPHWRNHFADAREERHGSGGLRAVVHIEIPPNPELQPCLASPTGYKYTGLARDRYCTVHR